MRRFLGSMLVLAVAAGCGSSTEGTDATGPDVSPPGLLGLGAEPHSAAAQDAFLQLKEKGIAVVAANYRLSPRAKSPAYIEDAAAAVAWTFHNIGKYGGSAKRIFVSGHSAGGYLAAMVGLDRRWLAVHQIDANSLAGLIPCSGQAITHFTIRAERGIGDKQPVVDDLAPLYHVRKDAPPMLLITGDRELELLGRYEELPYPPARTAGVDLFRLAKGRHYVPVLLEIDELGRQLVAATTDRILRESEFRAASQAGYSPNSRPVTTARPSPNSSSGIRPMPGKNSSRSIWNLKRRPVRIVLVNGNPVSIRAQEN